MTITSFEDAARITGFSLEDIGALLSDHDDLIAWNEDETESLGVTEDGLNVLLAQAES